MDGLAEEAGAVGGVGWEAGARLNTGEDCVDLATGTDRERERECVLDEMITSRMATVRPSTQGVMFRPHVGRSFQSVFLLVFLLAFHPKEAFSRFHSLPSHNP